MTPSICPKCRLLTDHRTGPSGPEQCPYDQLREAFGLDVSPFEDRQLHWLAGMDFETVDVVCEMFVRLRNAGGLVAARRRAPSSGKRKAVR
jgi:hypothetical protein